MLALGARRHEQRAQHGDRPHQADLGQGADHLLAQVPETCSPCDPVSVTGPPGAFGLSDNCGRSVWSGPSGGTASVSAHGQRQHREPSASSTTARSPRWSCTARTPATPSTAPPRRPSPTRSAPSTPTRAPASRCCTARAAPSAPAPTSRRSAPSAATRCRSPATARWDRPGCGSASRCSPPIEGYAVAGGLELAIWCDLRVAASDARLGVFCRRWGVPLIDGGTVRLPRLIGTGRALDLVLTGREVDAEEAQRIGLVDRVVPPGSGARGGRGARPPARGSCPRSACARTGSPSSSRRGCPRTTRWPTSCATASRACSPERSRARSGSRPARDGTAASLLTSEQLVAAGVVEADRDQGARPLAVVDVPADLEADLAQLARARCGSAPTPGSPVRRTRSTSSGGRRPRAARRLVGVGLRA